VNKYFWGKAHYKVGGERSPTPGRAPLKIFNFSNQPLFGGIYPILIKGVFKQPGVFITLNGGDFGENLGGGERHTRCYRNGL